ncbi:MAG TPA: SRPBCC family protein [Acidimicrobiia bacterium]|nr:SRPBCC family protein [Acidimicrobiia bacterium]
MNIKQEFVVARPTNVVWDFFQNVPDVAQCLPGANLTGQGEDGSYDGNLSVKLGPMAAAFEGNCVVVPDPDTLTATIEGKGTDRKGGSRGQVKVTYCVIAEGTGSRVTVDADLTLSGPAAQFGRTGLINEMSRRLIGDFVDCLEAKLAATNVEKASTIRAGEVRWVSLFFGSLWGWLKGLFKKG